MITLNNFKSTMIAKARKEGLCENFGQAELRQLENNYNANPFGNAKERAIAAQINELDNWAMNFDLSQVNN